MRDMLAKALPRIRNIVPQHLTAERLFAVAYVAMERNPKLLDCTAISVLRCVIIGAQMGLDVSGVGGMAYMVPFRNRKTDHLEATFITGYQGMIDLARRSKDIAWVFANLVYEHEQFDYSVNPIPRVYHKPLGESRKTRGQCVGGYALAIFRDKDVPPQPTVLTLEDIEFARSRSRAGNEGPWVTDWEPMAKKTCIRAGAKYWPQNPELAAAIDIEDRAERGEEIFLPGELTEAEVGIPEEPPSPAAAARMKGNDGVKARMGAKGKQPREPKPPAA